MLVAFSVASYSCTLAGYAVSAASGHQFWLDLAVALNLTGACAAALQHAGPEGPGGRRAA